MATTDAEKRAEKNAAQRKYRERNRELIAAKQREYAAAHRQQVKEYQKRYYQEHREADNARSAEWRKRNRERKREYDAAYREANRERIREAFTGHPGYVKRLRNAHGMRPEDWSAMLEAQNGLCCYCERPLSKDGAKGPHRPRPRLLPACEIMRGLPSRLGL